MFPFHPIGITVVLTLLAIFAKECAGDFGTTELVTLRTSRMQTDGSLTTDYGAQSSC